MKEIKVRFPHYWIELPYDLPLIDLARALARKPRLLLMDEPLSSVDALRRTALRNDIQRLQKQLKTTTVYVTHDQFEAMALGDRIAVLRAGRLEQLGRPERGHDQLLHGPGLLLAHHGHRGEEQRQQHD